MAYRGEGINYSAIQVLVTVAILGFLLVNHERKVDVRSLPPVHIASMPPISVAVDTVSISNTPSVNIRGFPEMSQDAAGRLRVAEPHTLGDYKHVYGPDQALLNYLENGGSIVYPPNQSSAVLTTSGTAGSRAVHQTKMYHHYMPGKSQVILTTFVMGEGQPNVTKRTGYYDDNNGIFLEQATANDGTVTVSWNIRSNVSGTPVVEKVTQNNWNTNPLMVGEFVLDLTKTQIAFVDMEWLGVGTVRVGFVFEGRYYVAHKFHHTNSTTGVYMANPNLPTRCEILNTASTGIGSMRQICSTVMSEGGYVEAGLDWSATTSNSGDILSVGGTVYPILAVRLKNNFKGYPNRMVVRPGTFSFFATNNAIMWSIYKLPSASLLTGELVWTSTSSESGVEYCLNAVDYMGGGDLLDSGYIAAGNSNTGNNAINLGNPTSAKRNFIVQNYDSSDSEVYLLAAMPVGTGNNLGARCYAAFQWREIY